MAIFAALRWECRPVLRRLRQSQRNRLDAFTVWRGRTTHHDVWLMKTGVGPDRAAQAAQAMISAGPFHLFMSTGCAGALADDLNPGDLAVATRVLADPAGPLFETDSVTREGINRAATRAALRTSMGPVLCSPHVLVTTAAKRAAAAHGSVAVEMEGVPIAACAAAHGVPFVSVRAILDSADTELQHSGRFVEPQTGAIKPLALAGYLASHPRAFGDLLALQRMMNTAEHSLNRFFDAWFAEEP